MYVQRPSTRGARILENKKMASALSERTESEINLGEKIWAVPEEGSECWVCGFCLQSKARQLMAWGNNWVSI